MSYLFTCVENRLISAHVGTCQLYGQWYNNILGTNTYYYNK